MIERRSSRIYLKLVALPILLLTAACSTQTQIINKDLYAQASGDEWTHFFVAGIGQESKRNAAQICGGSQNVVKVSTHQSFLNVLASVLSYNLYYPRTSKVYCARGARGDSRPEEMVSMSARGRKEQEKLGPSAERYNQPTNAPASEATEVPVDESRDTSPTTIPLGNTSPIAMLIRQGCKMHDVSLDAEGTQNWKLRCPNAGFVSVQLAGR